MVIVSIPRVEPMRRRLALLDGASKHRLLDGRGGASASPRRRMGQERLGQKAMPRLGIVFYADRGSTQRCSRMVFTTTVDISGNMVMTWHCWTRLPLAAAQKLARRSVVESQKHTVERDKR